MRLLLSLLFCSLTHLVNAQNSSGPEHDLSRLDHHNNVYKGTILPDFSAITVNGKPVNNDILRNRVSLLVFWYPTCGCYNFHKLDSLTAIYKSDPRFQVIVIGSDTAGLAAYRAKGYMPYTYLALGSESKMHELNFGNGFPSLALVNRAGVVEQVSMFKNPIGYLDKIRELLML